MIHGQPHNKIDSLVMHYKYEAKCVFNKKKQENKQENILKDA